jgi:hypothetical protein
MGFFDDWFGTGEVKTGKIKTGEIKTGKIKTAGIGRRLDDARPEFATLTKDFVRPTKNLASSRGDY